MGISLDLPSTYLNDSTAFTPPTKKDAERQSTENPADGPTSFLWQAPNSDAVLFFGPKWIELHSFVSRLFDAQHRLPASPAAFLSSKSVSKRYPAWLEHALRLCRARGYWTLYPGDSPGNGMATVHTELYRAPEEYEEEEELVPASGGERGSAAGQKQLARELVLDHRAGGLLPPFRELPLLSWEGEVVGLEELDRAAAEYTAEFRGSVGGCEDLEPLELRAKSSAADLFCERE